MNKIFTKKLLMAMMLLTVSITINAQTKKEVFEETFKSIRMRMTPADYSVGNKSSLYFYNFDGYDIYGSEAPTFYIYDSNFTKQKTIEVPMTPVSYYTITQEREKGQVLGLLVSDEMKVSTWDPNTGDEVFEFTTESAENYAKERYGEIRTKDETSEAIIFYFTAEYTYYRYESYGYQYPERYFKYEKSTSILYECSDSYSETSTYTNTWKEPVREDYQIYTSPLSISRVSDVDTNSFRLSQTLFNTDNAYEYILPIITTETEEGQEIMGWDDAKQQEVVVRKITGTTIRVSGLKIVNENGATVNTITFDSNFNLGYYDQSVDIIDLDGNIYLAVEGNLKKSATESVRATIIYSIDAQTNSVRQLSMEEGMRVSPTMPRRSEMITITLEGNSDQSRQVNIVNATGRTVKRINVPAGQRSVQVNASELSTGLNIVNVSGQKTQACKIIVR